MTSSEKLGIKSPLKLHEWCAVISFFSLLITLFFYTSFYRADDETAFLSISEEPYQVLLKGSVEVQGVYLFSKAIKLNDLLDIAKVSIDADLNRVNLNREAPRGGVISIPKKKEGVGKK